MKIKSLFIISILLFVLTFSAACLNLDLSEHDEADKIYADYVYGGYYYFEDDNGRSFNKTLWEGDFSNIPNQYEPNQWIDYVRSLKYIKDADDGEIFYNAWETIERGGGDCEDLSILLARGLYEMGFDTCIIVQKEHILAGIDKSQVDSKYKGIYKNLQEMKTHKDVVADKYYVLESTIEWGIGEYDETSPIEYEKIYELKNSSKIST